MIGTRQITSPLPDQQRWDILPQFRGTGLSSRVFPSTLLHQTVNRKTCQISRTNRSYGCLGKGSFKWFTRKIICCWWCYCSLVGFPPEIINSGNACSCHVMYPLRVPFVMSLDESPVKNKKKNEVWWAGAKLWSVEGTQGTTQRGCTAKEPRWDESTYWHTPSAPHSAHQFTRINSVQLPSHSVWGILWLFHFVHGGRRHGGIVSK